MSSVIKTILDNKDSIKDVKDLSGLGIEYVLEHHRVMRNPQTGEERYVLKRKSDKRLSNFIESRGGATALVVKVGASTVLRTETVCSKQDNYNKTTARQILIDRFLKDLEQDASVIQAEIAARIQASKDREAAQQKFEAQQLAIRQAAAAKRAQKEVRRANGEFAKFEAIAKSKSKRGAFQVDGPAACVAGTCACTCK